MIPCTHYRLPKVGNFIGTKFYKLNLQIVNVPSFTQIKTNHLLKQFSLLANFEKTIQCAYFKNVNLYNHETNYLGR